MKAITLQEMLSTIIGELRENGRWGTAHIYQSTLNVFSVFNNHQNLHLRKLNPVVLKRFEMHLRQRDCSWNTVSTYMKAIRSAYNRAVDSRYVRYTPRLFEHVYTGTKADKKRALEASDIGALVRGTEIELSMASFPFIQHPPQRPRSNDTSQSPPQGECHGFVAYGVQPLDNLFVASHLYAEDEEQQPDEQRDDLMDFL